MTQQRQICHVMNKQCALYLFWINWSIFLSGFWTVFKHWPFFKVSCHTITKPLEHHSDFLFLLYSTNFTKVQCVCRLKILYFYSCFHSFIDCTVFCLESKIHCLFIYSLGQFYSTGLVPLLGGSEWLPNKANSNRIRMEWNFKLILFFSLSCAVKIFLTLQDKSLLRGKAHRLGMCNNKV